MSTAGGLPAAASLLYPMTPEHWQQVKEILEAALDRDAATRPQYLDDACARNPVLRRDVEALLALEGEVDSFLEVPAFDLHDGESVPSLEGRVVDRYRIVREIGTGGMGRVFLAERADHAFEQRVALKVLKRGLDTEEIVGRFRRERQILADLEHPNVARILDGGTTEDGLPYLVAEHVEGTPIDLYCERMQLSVERRLELFCQVCDAVQFAHQNFVVHRDLKAANILIAEGGVPKLLDFGIAKILSPDGDDFHRTVAGLHFMTPEVASPEQIRGERVTTASDVYSLGVLLYDLLTGKNPHTARGTSRAAVERAVREELPERPSLAASPELRRTLRGDLDNILLKALRKEPERRYGTARELADDIRRYLTDLPVTASGDAWSYRLPKLLKRHKVAAISVAVIVSLAIAFTVAAVSLLSQTTRERQRAQRVSTFLEELLTLSDPGRARGEDLTVREALDNGRKRIFDGLEDEPELRAELMDTMARVYLSLGLYDDARDLFQEALKLRTQVLGRDDLLVAETLHGFADTMRSLGDTGATERLLRRALAIQRSRHAEDHPEYLKGLNNLAILYEEREDYHEAERLHREVLTTKRRILGPEDPEVAVTLHNLAKLLFLQGEYTEAEARYREALEIRERHHGAVSLEVARTLNGLASAVEALGRLDEAEELYRRSLEIRRKFYPEGHPEVAFTLSNLAMLLQDRGELDAAEPLFREALTTLEKFLPATHPSRAIVMRNLASLLTAEGKAVEAEQVARRAVEILRNGAEPGSWRVADAESVLGGALDALGRYEEATPLILGSYSLLQDLQGRDSPYTRQAFDRLTELYEHTGNGEQAASDGKLADR
jgi:serine/threonine-protein kinase